MNFFAFFTNSKKKIISIIFWLILWTFLSNIIQNNILLPNPIQVVFTLLNLVRTKTFWISIFNSVINIGSGFLISIFLGIFLAFTSHFFPILEYIIKLPINLIRSIPIASITIVLLIWISSSKLSIFLVLFVSLPNIYFSSKAGLNNVDIKLLQMAYAFDAKTFNIFKFLYWDKLKEFLLPSIIVTSGMAWKSGVSGEVLGLVNNSIGENIYYSKLYLLTEELFAWTFVIIILANLFQWIINKTINEVI